MRHVHSMAALAFSLACGVASSALAAEEFAVLAGKAVTCTVSSVQGNVGLANTGTITNTSCAITGNIAEGTAAAQDAYAAFLTSYNSYRDPQNPLTCKDNNLPLSGANLPPGVYCYGADVAVTGGTLTLVGTGSANDAWTFLIGTGGTGAFTGTNFNVVMTGGATCDNNVTWWTAQGATLTDSTFIGSVLAGADITVTRGSLAGQVLAGGTGTTSARTGAVTLTGTVIDFCADNIPPPGPPVLPVFVIGDVEPHAINQGVNFWGAQWWKNNILSGIVGPGTSRASFKGFATSAKLFCGGFWESLPGNSPPPPATLAADIAVVVTSSVMKNGPNLHGDIREIVVVQQDGGYAPNPGHEGRGTVKSVVCTQ